MIPAIAIMICSYISFRMIETFNNKESSIALSLLAVLILIINILSLAYILISASKV